MSDRQIPLSVSVYRQLKQAIFSFEILPGDRFTETSLAKQYNVSRTPVREALLNLEREGFVSSRFKGGWLVKELNFDTFEDLYDVRIMLESKAIELLCKRSLHKAWVDEHKSTWLCHPDKRLRDGRKVAKLDEDFHSSFIAACKNEELSKIYLDITDRIRIVRTLDFTEPARINATYVEHGQIIGFLENDQFDAARTKLENHILSSRQEVRSITMLRLHAARSLRYD